MSRSLRIIFAGTPDFAAHHLDALIQEKHQIVGVYTRPDRPAGRGHHLTSSPVKKLAERHYLPILQPFSQREPESQKWLSVLKSDIMVVVAYGLILPEEVLKKPRLGCINVHGSLLPRWRGAAPIQRALWAGDNQTGITIIKMDAGLDTGEILHQTICSIQSNDTSASLYNKLAKIGSNALLTTLKQFSKGITILSPQNESLATYASKISKKEAKLNWYLSATHLERCIRAFNPWPISYFKVSEKLIKVWAASAEAQKNTLYVSPGTIISRDKNGIRIATGNGGILTLTQLQPESKKIMSASEFLNLYQKYFIPGQVLD